VLLAAAAFAIIQQHCVACHRAGEVAPFSLQTYEDARSRAKLIARVTASGYMPPWKPVRGYGRFQGERRLTEAQIATLQRWAAAPAKSGPVGMAASTPDPAAPKPDLTVEMQREYALPAEGPDSYRCFVLPGAADADRWVRSVEYLPSNRKIVHHALFFTTTQRGLPDEYSCFGTPGFVPSSSLGGWSPGNRRLQFPSGTAMKIPKGARIVLQLHFHPNGKIGTERSRLGLYLAPGPPQRHLVDVGLISKAIDIPPGDRAYKVRDHFTLPVDVHAVGIIPHAHYVCREVKGWATLPGGRRVWLLWIRDWDFDWQDRYWYREPVALPAGTRVDMEFTYDNSTANPRNPNSPPQRVTWGAGTSDEMAGLHVQVIPDREEDLPELGQALWGKVMRMVGGSFRQPPAKEGDHLP
jgi:hypothetical protein